MSLELHRHGSTGASEIVEFSEISKTSWRAVLSVVVNREVRGYVQASPCFQTEHGEREEYGEAGKKPCS